MKPSVMIIGLGNLGSVVLELLAREEGIGRIVVGSLDEKRGAARCNLVRLSAHAQGFFPQISFVPLDLNNKEAVAEAVHQNAPDLIFSAAAMQTWWLTDLLPSPQASIIKNAGFGIWLPVHLTLMMKLMEALRDAAYDGLTVTAPYPDVVNFILARLGMAPTCGVGNIDEIVPKVRLLAAERLSVPIDSIQVILIAHHALEAAVFGDAKDEIPPYFLRVEHNGQDMTEDVHVDELLFAPFAISSGPAVHYLTAGCTVRLINALLSDKSTVLHAPAPNGLPGGYPVKADNKGVKPALNGILPLDEAIDINERSHHFDGIEGIEADGTAVFSPSAVQVFYDTLGYYCERLSPFESEERAKELIARFHKYAEQYGINFQDFIRLM